MSVFRFTPGNLVTLAFVGQLLIWIVASICVLALVDLPTGGTEVDLPVESAMIAQLVGYLPLFAIAFVIERRLRNASGIGWRGRSGVGFHILGAYAIVLAFWGPFTFLVYPRLLEMVGVTLEAQPHLAYFIDPPGGPKYWLVLAVVCVFGPVAEEIVFRGYLQTGLRGLIGARAGLLITSLLFGLMHGLELALPLACMGAFFGYLREQDDGMLAPIAAHVLHNSATVLTTSMWPELFNQVYSR